MSFEKVKSFWKEINKVNIYYFKEKRKIMITICLFYAILSSFAFSYFAFPYLVSMILSHPVILVLIIICASYSLTFITLFLLEKYKVPFFDELINKVEKYKSFPDTQNNTKRTFVYLKIILIIGLLTLAGLVIVNNSAGNKKTAKRLQPKIDTKYKKEVISVANNLIFDSNDKQTYDIQLNPPAELDFLSKEEIFSKRTGFAFQSSHLINKDYTPSGNVFQIVGNKPWWGIIGVNCKGAGKNSIDGLSEESRFINNPLLLIGIDSYYAFRAPFGCKSFYPEPVKLFYQPLSKKGTVVYNISKFYSDSKGTAWGQVKDLFVFRGDNARDFGYNYAYVESKTNVKFAYSDNLAQKVHKIRNFIHLGGSCGHPEGCNNGSPKQTAFQFDVTQLPANVVMKLWKENPTGKETPADLYFEIVLK